MKFLKKFESTSDNLYTRLYNLFDDLGNREDITESDIKRIESIFLKRYSIEFYTYIERSNKTLNIKPNERDIEYLNDDVNYITYPEVVIKLKDDYWVIIFNNCSIRIGSTKPIFKFDSFDGMIQFMDDYDKNRVLSEFERKFGSAWINMNWGKQSNISMDRRTKWGIK